MDSTVVSNAVPWDPMWKIFEPPMVLMWDSILPRLKNMAMVMQNVKKMTTTIKDLEATRTRVVTNIEAAMWKQMKSTPKAACWLEKVEEVVADVIRVEDQFENSGCFFLVDCSMNCGLSQRIGEEAASLCARAVSLKMDVDSFEWAMLSPPESIQEMFFSFKVVESRTLKSHIHMVHSYLQDGNVRMVGIWSMGAVGKTTLVTKIKNAFLDEECLGFDYVIYVAAKRNDTMKNLLSDLATRLGLDLPSPRNVQSTADGISMFLEQKNFLLLIDDLWEAFDLKTVGIPVSSSSQHKHKVVITMRFEDVCARMNIPPDKQIKVKCLKPDEAMDLFKETVGDVIHNTQHCLYLHKMWKRNALGCQRLLLSSGRPCLPRRLSMSGSTCRFFPVIENTTMMTPVGSDPVQRIADTSSYDYKGKVIDRNLEGMLNHLRDEMVGVEGIWGPGGVGNITLLGRINNSLKGDRNLWFDHVIWVVASKDLPFKKLREDIAERLKLSPSFIIQISVFLKNKFLLLRDDLWEDFNLNEVGIPQPLCNIDESQRTQKVVLTTRNAGVCSCMQVDKIIKVGCLESEEALQVFRAAFGGIIKI